MEKFRETLFTFKQHSAEQIPFGQFFFLDENSKSPTCYPALTKFDNFKGYI